MKLFRQMELPRFLRVLEDWAELAATVDEVCSELGLGSLYFVTGKSVSYRLASLIESEIGRTTSVGLCTVADNSWQSVGQVREEIESAKPEVVLAVGGGTVIDVAKAACLEVQVPVIAIPTLLSTDSIASPISVLAERSGSIDSYPAKLPVAVLVDIDTIAHGPVEAARAGFGDLVSNRSAVEDWRLAERAGKEKVDDFAALLSESAAELAWSFDVSSLGSGSPTKELLRRMLHGLVLSGLAMEIAGSSRPCSGAEHLISHAIDRLYPGTAGHGEQVAFGSIVATYLRGGDWQEVKELLRSAGMQAAAGGFGLGSEKIVEAIVAAPGTRPGRYTVLDETGLGEETLLATVEKIISDRPST